jgi:hypothetical protein
MTIHKLARIAIKCSSQVKICNSFKKLTDTLISLVEMITLFTLKK